MNTPFDITEDGHPIVYVKEVDIADLPEEVQAQLGDRDHLYAVHDAEGQRLALVTDRNMAFVLARQNDLEPVTVH